MRLRALGDGGGELDTLLDAAARWICAQTSLVVGAEDVARLLDAGSAVVLFDGFDEITNPDARARTAEWLQAFTLRFPGVPVVVTSDECRSPRADAPESGAGRPRREATARARCTAPSRRRGHFADSLVLGLRQEAIASVQR